MDSFITPALARANPKAYRARVLNLSPNDRSQVTRGLSLDDYRAHVLAVEGRPTAKVLLQAKGLVVSDFTLSRGPHVTRLEKTGWPQVALALQQQLALCGPWEVDAQLMVPSAPDSEAEVVFQTGLRALDWKLERLELVDGTRGADVTRRGRFRVVADPGPNGLVYFEGRTTPAGTFTGGCRVDVSAHAAWAALAERLGVTPSRT